MKTGQLILTSLVPALVLAVACTVIVNWHKTYDLFLILGADGGVATVFSFLVALATVVVAMVLWCCAMDELEKKK